MTEMKLWIAFHHHAGESLDDWEVYLEGGNVAECESWAAIGSTCEFRAMHLKGVRSETMPGFKNKYLLKDHLTPAEVAMVRNVASEQPLDNEADFWDGRIYCFEIINQLESDGVLDRNDEQYRNTRQLLSAKWRTSDGTTNWGSHKEEEVWCRAGHSSSDAEEEEKGLIKLEEPRMPNGIYLNGVRAMGS